MRVRSVAAACAAALAASVALVPAAGATTPTAVYGAWGSAQELPGLSTTGYVQVLSVACPPSASGACAVGGSLEGSSGSQAFVSQQDNGTWSTQFIAASSDAPSPSAVNQLACTSPGNCVAVGTYTADASTGAEQAFTATETNGAWSEATPLPGLAALDIGGYPDINGLACPSAGNCEVVGDYGTDLDSYGISSEWDAFLAEEVNGTWQQAIEVPGIATLGVGGSTSSAVTCPAAGDCVINGYYHTGADETGTIDASPPSSRAIRGTRRGSRRAPLPPPAARRPSASSAAPRLGTASPPAARPAPTGLTGTRSSSRCPAGRCPPRRRSPACSAWATSRARRPATAW